MKVKDQAQATNTLEWESPLYKYNVIQDLEKKYGTSFYVLNVNKLRENYQKINAAFKSRYSNFIIGYSYKTNYLPYLCKELYHLGAYAEVVSRLEYDLALKIGVSPKNIIFNGPLKSLNDIELALNHESKINLDSFYEVDHIKQYSEKNPDKQINIGLRLNFDLSENGVSPLVEGFEISRFGICVESGTLKDVLRALDDLKNVRVVGLHGHFSTSKRSVDTYSKITKKLCQIVKEHQLQQIEYIDIGGGIFGEVPKTLIAHAPTFDEYAEAICGILHREFANTEHKPTLILEPGLAMVANTISFVSKVIEIKTVRDQKFVLVDGSVHNIKPTLHQKNLPMKIIEQHERDTSQDENYHIVGYTCLEKDYLARNVNGKIPQKVITLFLTMLEHTQSSLIRHL